MKDFLNRKVNISNKNVFSKGSYYIISSKSCFLTKKQVESCVGLVSFYIKRYKKNKQFLSCVQYKIPVTQKSKGSRMGSGKGKIKEYLAKVNMNGIIFIFKKVKLWRMYKIFKGLQSRLPMKIQLKTYSEKTNLKLSKSNHQNHNRRSFSRLLNKNKRINYSTYLKNLKEIKTYPIVRFLEYLDDNEDFYKFSVERQFNLILWKLKKEIVSDYDSDFKDITFKVESNDIHLYANKDLSYFGYFALVTNLKIIYTINNINYNAFVICYLTDNSYYLNSEWVLLYIYIHFPIDFMVNSDYNDIKKAETFVLDTILRDKNLIDKIKIKINILFKKKFINE